MRAAKYRVSVRRANRNDISRVLEIENESFASDAWDSDCFFRYLARSERTLLLVAAIRETVIGYAAAIQRQNRAEVESIAVSSAYRGQGVAEKLLRRLLRILHWRAVTTVSLMVRCDNTAAVQLYQKVGFQKLGRVNWYYEDGGPALRMQYRWKN